MLPQWRLGFEQIRSGGRRPYHLATFVNDEVEAPKLGGRSKGENDTGPLWALVVALRLLGGRG